MQVGRVAKRGVVVFGYEEATLGQGRLLEKVIAEADPKPTVALVSVVAKGERRLEEEDRLVVVAQLEVALPVRIIVERPLLGSQHAEFG